MNATVLIGVTASVALLAGLGVAAFRLIRTRGQPLAIDRLRAAPGLVAAFRLIRTRGRLFGLLLGLLVAVSILGLFYPVLFPVRSDTVAVSGPADPVTITDYRADFAVDSLGDLGAIETLTVNFPQEPRRHGIFRFWDLDDQSNPAARYEVHDITVALDGEDVGVELATDPTGRYLEARIGDPNNYIEPGQHTFQIGYGVDGVLADPLIGVGDSFSTTQEGSGQEPASVFYWKVIPPGWGMPIEKAFVTVAFPEATTGVQCSAGTPSSQCEIGASDATHFAVTATGLPPYSGVTVRAGLPSIPPSQTVMPWSRVWDDVFGPTTQFRRLMLIAALAAGLLGLWASHSVGETNRAAPLCYQPPAGLGPVQAAYLLGEAPGEHAIAATLVGAAEQGLLTLQWNGSAWLIIGNASRQQWQASDPVTGAVGEALGLQTQGATVVADGSVVSGTSFTAAQQRIDEAIKRWRDTSGLFRVSAMDNLYLVIWVLAAVAAFVVALIRPTFAALPFMAFVIGGFGVLQPGRGHRRTRAGWQAYSAAAGFRRVLATESAQDRAALAAIQDQFLPYLPHAMAFGVAGNRSRKFRSVAGQAPAVTPVWFVDPTR
jgi:hypothetical protein